MEKGGWIKVGWCVWHRVGWDGVRVGWVLWCDMGCGGDGMEHGGMGWAVGGMGAVVWDGVWEGWGEVEWDCLPLLEGCCRSFHSPWMLTAQSLKGFIILYNSSTPASFRVTVWKLCC